MRCGNLHLPLPIPLSYFPNQASGEPTVHRPLTRGCRNRPGLKYRAASPLVLTIADMNPYHFKHSLIADYVWSPACSSGRTDRGIRCTVITAKTPQSKQGHTTFTISIKRTLGDLRRRREAPKGPAKADRWGPKTRTMWGAMRIYPHRHPFDFNRARPLHLPDAKRSTASLPAGQLDGAWF